MTRHRLAAAGAGGGHRGVSLPLYRVSAGGKRGVPGPSGKAPLPLTAGR